MSGVTVTPLRGEPLLVDADPLSRVKVTTEGAVAYGLPSPSTGPYVEPVLALHRAPDEAYVTLHSKYGGEFRDLCAIRSDLLTVRFAHWKPHLEEDAYFSINSFYRPGFGNPTASGDYRASRRTCDLRYLNACYVDLDIYKVNLTVDAALGAVFDAQDRGHIPAPTMLVSSGQGLWLFWFLTDIDEPTRPQRAWPEKVRWYSRIEAGIVGRLTHIGADPRAQDPVRITRVPGSRNSKTGERVMYWYLESEDSERATYSLDDLTAAFDVPKPQYHKREKGQVDGDVSEKTRRRGELGYRALYEKRLRQFEQLEAMRGGFKEGHRNSAALVLANTLYRLGESRDTVAWRVDEMADRCTPPLGSRECDAVVWQASKYTKLCNQKIADWLEVTSKESSRLETWPAGVGQGKQEQLVPAEAKPTRREAAKARRAAILGVVRALWHVPSTREMASCLKWEGYTASHTQISSDYKALGLRSGREPSPIAEEGV